MCLYTQSVWPQRLIALPPPHPFNNYMNKTYSATKVRFSQRCVGWYIADVKIKVTPMNDLGTE